MDNNYNCENEYLRELLKDNVKTLEKVTNGWQKTIKFIVLVMAITTFLTISISLGVFFKYYFTTDYSQEVEADNTNTNINTNTNTNE